MNGLNTMRSWLVIPLTAGILWALCACCCTGGLDDERIPLVSPDPVPPVAQVTPDPSGGEPPLAVGFDAGGSYDPDGEIVRYDWDMDNDGTYEVADGGVTADWTFEEDGTYTVGLRVTDDDGLQDTTTTEVVVATDVAPPTALGTSTVDETEPLMCHFDATESFDTDGVIVCYDWDYDGDGIWDVIDGTVDCCHTYPTYGTYTVLVRVTDDDGLTDIAEIPVVLTEEPNDPPLAVLTPDPASGEPDLAVTWDASASSDPDGEVVRYDWDMDNDGNYEILDGGATQPATYTSPGTVTVGVMVTDDDGATDSTTADVVVNVPATLVRPVAVLTPDPAHGTRPLLVTWDATLSHDPDGTIDRYAWDMDNDGTFEATDGAATVPVTYTMGGTYTVGVRVTDNDGMEDSATAVVEVNNPPIADLEADPPSGYAPGFLTEYSAAGSVDLDGMIVRYDWDMDNDGIFELNDGGVTQLKTYDADGDYTVNVRVHDDDGAMDEASTIVHVGERLPPNAVLSATPDHGNAPGLMVAFDASASSDPDGVIIQYDWDLDEDGVFELVDGGPVQSVTYDHGSIHTVSVLVIDDDLMTDSAGADVDVNNPPVADLQCAPAVGEEPLMVSFNATGSTDSDGYISRYDYDFDNDGTYESVDAGPTPFYNFASYGVYPVNLLVHDDDGATDTTSTTVTVLAPPNAVLDHTQSGSIPELQITYDATGSWDSDGVIVQYDWDMDDDGAFELIGAASTQVAWYSMGGEYTVHVRVTDNDGLQDIASLTLDFNGPPVAVINTDPDPPVIYHDYGEFTLDGTASYDLDGTVVQYDWDFDGDGTWDVIDGLAVYYQMYYLPPQEWRYSWTVWLRVHDDDGATDMTSVVVTLNLEGEPV